ncbi:MAG: hypothetical protein AAGC46_10715 [Solirubrobacteraceae bacterium]|nr:hypothetical protein [Patulibacter sp.]
MARWRRWLDRYETAGLLVGLLAFLGLGALEDFGTSAGGEAWIFSACVGVGAAYLAATALRLRSGVEIVPRERVEVTPRSYAFTVAATVGAAGIVWGIAVGPGWLAGLAFVVFAVGWAGRTRLRFDQIRRREPDGT